MSTIDDDRDRQHMSGTIVGMNCHPHLPTRSLLKHPVLDNMVTWNHNLRKEQQYNVFNSKVSGDDCNGSHNTVNDSNIGLNLHLKKKRKKNSRKSRWLNTNRKELNIQSNKKKLIQVQSQRIHKSTLRLNEKQIIFQNTQLKLDKLESASVKTKRTIRYSHRLVDCLDLVEGAKNELDKCQVFHKKASSTRYRVPHKRNKTYDNTQCLTFDTPKKYNLRKYSKKSVVECTEELQEHDSDTSDPTFIIQNHQQEQFISSESDKTIYTKGLLCNEDDNCTSYFYDSSDDQLNLNQWVYDLKSMDKETQPFFSKSLVIVRGNHKCWEKKDWSQIYNIPRNHVLKTIHELIIIQRSDKGQLYMVQGLQRSLHFSLGSQGAKTLKNFLTKVGVKVWKGSHTKKYLSVRENLSNSYIPNGLYVKSVKQAHMSPLELGYHKLMENTASGLWTTLFGVSYYILLY